LKQKRRIYSLTVCALMAAVMCVLGPISVPIGAVPISLTNLAVCLAVCLLGTKWGTASVGVYLLLGVCGMPVFSGYTGGLAKLAGPTGGYLIGFLFMAAIGGVFLSRFHGHVGGTLVGMALGVLVSYAFGTAWFIFQTQCTLAYALTVCVLPFLLWDAAKITVATLVGQLIRRQLIRAQLLDDVYGEVRSAAPVAEQTC
jgi:biotin transport system substrate-specific component